MDVPTVLITIILPLVVLYLLHSLRPVLRVMYLAMKVPTGWDSWPIIGHIPQLFVPRNRLLTEATQLHKRSKQLYAIWLGPVPVLIITKPKHVEVVLSNVKYIDKMFNYAFLYPWLGTGLITSTGSKWHSHRRIIMPAFHYNILENSVDVFVEKTRILVKKLEKEVGSAEFDISRYVTLCALDIILETAMGVDMKAQDQEEQSQYVQACCKITDEFINRSLNPILYPDFIYKYSPSGRRTTNYTQILHAMTNKVIKERKNLFKNRNPDASLDDDAGIGRKKKMAFLDILLQTSGNSMADEEIREEVDTIMFAGHDTSSAAMCWAIQLLASHPDIQDRVYEELEGIFQGSDRPATTQDLMEMKYLERVIKETQRLYPSVPIIGRELKEDLVLDGYTIPSRMNLGIVPYLTHRDEENFANPNEFDPDRFLPERVVNKHPYAYIPFSAGPRNCIGQKFAMLEMKMVLSSILRSYKVKAVGDFPVALPEIVLRPENGVHVQIAKRDSTA